MIVRFTYFNVNNEKSIVNRGNGGLHETEHGIMYSSPSGSTKILIPWGRIVEVWYG